MYLIKHCFFLFLPFHFSALAEGPLALTESAPANKDVIIDLAEQNTPQQNMAKPAEQNTPQQNMAKPAEQNTPQQNMAKPAEQNPLENMAKEAIKKNKSKPPPHSNVHYGEIFMEETKSIDLFPYELSVSGGGELASPYINSSFFGMEIKHRVHSFGQLGLEYAIHSSQPTTTLKSLRKKMSLYGLEISYPFLKHQAYINWHYTFFQSHINLASLFRITMTVPLQLGFGVMDMEQKNMRMALKWGAGPRISLSRRWAVQLLLSQSISLHKVQFLYTWYSLKFIYGL